MQQFKRLSRLVLTVLLSGAFAFTFFSCNNNQADKEELENLRRLAEADREELQQQYAELSQEYEQMRQVVHDDSLLVQLEQEQRRAEQLIKELRAAKASDAAEILRLKQELETVRAVLRDYIRQVDSLQQLNIALTGERDAALEDAKQSRQRNQELATNNEQLRQTVEVASQLNATGVQLLAQKKNGKNAAKAKDVKRFVVNFAIARNVTASTGNREVYVRLMKPNQEVAAAAGSMTYEGKQIQYSARKTIEYDGEETHATLYIPTAEFLSAGTYSIYIFCDGQMIGSGKTTLQ